MQGFGGQRPRRRSRLGVRHLLHFFYFNIFFYFFGLLSFALWRVGELTAVCRVVGRVVCVVFVVLLRCVAPRGTRYFFQQGAHQVLLVLLNAEEVVEDQRRTDQILQMWERIARFVFKLSEEDQGVVYDELRRQGMAETLAFAMGHHPHHPPVLRRGAFLLAQLFAQDAPAKHSDEDPSARTRMLAAEGLVDLFRAMESQPATYSPDLLAKVLFSSLFFSRALFSLFFLASFFRARVTWSLRWGVGARNARGGRRREGRRRRREEEPEPAPRTAGGGGGCGGCGGGGGDQAGGGCGARPQASGRNETRRAGTARR